MNAESSALRAEIAAFRKEMHEGFAAARDEMRVGLAKVTDELGRQIQEAAEEGKRHTRVLFEEVVSRIAALAEHREASVGRKSRGRRKR
jgi:enoyl reductase-like protein